MFVSIYYKPSLFNAHTMILIVHSFMNVNKLWFKPGVRIVRFVHIFMNVNKLCLNQV